LLEDYVMTKITKMPGVDTDAPKIDPNEFNEENELMAELKVLIENYNGKMSNVAMIGCIQITLDMLTLNLMTQGM